MRGFFLSVEAEAEGAVSAEVLCLFYDVFEEAGAGHDFGAEIVAYRIEGSVDVVSHDGWSEWLVVNGVAGPAHRQPLLGQCEELVKGVLDYEVGP